eukprot:5388323-Pleurochrysis_carterae.AAC.2
MREFDDLSCYMTERHLSEYVSSPVSTAASHSLTSRRRKMSDTEVFIKHIIAIERYLEPESLAADSDCRSDSMLSDDDVVPPAEFPEHEPPAGETSHVGDAYSPCM